MSLSLNSQAPDFTLPSTSGNNFTLSVNSKNKPCIIYFYPKNFTPVCTKEACSFRDTFNFFKEIGISVYGISRDTISSHLEFKQVHDLPFELLSDLDGHVANLYDASVPIINFTRRVTYLLDADHTVRGVYENIFASKDHVREMVKAIKEQSSLFKQVYTVNRESRANLHPES